MPKPESSPTEELHKLLAAFQMDRGLEIAAKHIVEHAPQQLRTAQSILWAIAQDDSAPLLRQLNSSIRQDRLVPETGRDNSLQCDVWCFYGYFLNRCRKHFQAIDVFNSIYEKLLALQHSKGLRIHKGLPLFHLSQVYEGLSMRVHAKRYMMLTLCEDAISYRGTLNRVETGSYAGLSVRFGLADREIRRYGKQTYMEFVSDKGSGAYPEWILQQLDQRWKTELPSPQEAGMYRVSPAYCNHLLAAFGTGDGKSLERLAEYLVAAMPGCRTHRRKRTRSGELDIVATIEGPISDYRSELGRYFACECKDLTDERASFTDVAKFCRVLDSIKAKFGIFFSTNSVSGKGKSLFADNEIRKLYQDRGIVLVVVDRDDLSRVAEGENLISLLREKYEAVRLDLWE